MIDCFDLMYEEGEDRPGLMSIGLHDRLIGRPSREPGLARFLAHVHKHDRVWFCRGVDIAEHWMRTHPPARSHGISGLSQPQSLWSFDLRS